MAHLAARPNPILAVEVKLGLRVVERLAPALDITPDQIVHDRIGMALGRAGAVNAALYAAAILALADPAVAVALDNWRRAQSEAVPERPDSR